MCSNIRTCAVLCGRFLLEIRFLVTAVPVRDLRRIRQPRMYNHAIPEPHRLARLERHRAAAVLVIVKIVLAENVGREQTIIASVPVRRVLRILRMVEDCDAILFAVQRTRIVLPRERLSPDLLHPLRSR